MRGSTYDWELWSTECRLVVTDPDALVPAMAVVRPLLQEIELACSRFRRDSELMRLRAGWNVVSPMLTELVAEALTAAWLTDGAVDPTIGGPMRNAGYDRDLAQLGHAPIRVVRPAPGWRTLRLDGHRLYRQDDVQLDLGATAKAVAADRTAAAVAEAVGCGVLVSLGGDIATAGDGPAGGWQVTVQDLPDDAPQQVTLTDGAAVATSSTLRRTWQHGTLQMHHVLDPATGMPARGPWRTATVVAEDCARANTASTAAIVKGDAALPWLRRLGLPARLVDRSGRVLTLNGFPEEAAA